MSPLKLQGKELDDDDAGRWARYTRYLDFYKGLQQSNNNSQRGFTVNYARTLIRKSAAFLLGAGVRYECADKRAETALEEVAVLNGFVNLDFETAIDSMVLGDGGWKITKRKFGHVCVRSVDVCNVTATWAGDDVRRLLSVTEQYMLSKSEILDLYGVGVLDDFAKVVEEWTDKFVTIRIADDDNGRC